MATIKQKLAAKELVANGGNVPKALKKAGYSQSIIRNSQRVTASEGFQQVIERMGVSDEKLVKVLDEGLGATKAVVMGVKSDESFVDIQPDFAIRHKYLETAVKLKGHLKTDDTVAGNTYNTFIQQNSINPNAPEAKELVEQTLTMLMEKTRRGQGAT